VIRVDEEADAFFKLGDEGTYVGGPRSFPPVLRESDDEELAVGLGTEQLERRDRLKRFVTTLVGALSAAVMVLLPFKLGAFGSAVLQKPTGVKAPALATRPAVVAAVAAPLVAPPPPAAVSEPVAGRASRAAPAGIAVPEPRRAAAPLRVASLSRHAVSKSQGAFPAHALPPGRVSRGFHAPPTASFPD
jgi:hypothetical protein